MPTIKQQAEEVIHNLNWMLEAHDSSIELIEVEDDKVIVRCIGHCAECESDCIGVAFQERMPDIKLILQ